MANPLTVGVALTDAGFGLPPGPQPFTRKAWDHPAKYKLSRYGDEFAYSNFTQLNRVWQTHLTTAADFDFPGGSAIEWNPPVAGAALYRPIPSYDFEAVLEVTRHRTISRWTDMFGLGVVDASGNGLGYSYDYDGNSYEWALTGWVYSGTLNAHVASGSLESGGTHVYTALRKTGTTVQGRDSADGASFNTVTSGSTLGTTPLYLVIGRFLSNASEAIRLHRINVYSGPTFFPG